MLIRPARAEDFDAIAALTNHYIQTTAIHFSYEPVTARELRESWEKSVKTYPYLVGSDESGGLVGYAKSGRWRDRAAYDRTAEVGIYIQPGLHGNGLGKRLYLALIDECKRRGFHTLVGGVALPNEASVRLHLTCGFTPVGVFRQVGWKMNAWHDVGWYQLMMGEGDRG